MYFYSGNEFIQIQHIQYEQCGLIYVKKSIWVYVSAYMKLDNWLLLRGRRVRLPVLFPVLRTV